MSDSMRQNANTESTQFKSGPVGLRIGAPPICLIGYAWVIIATLNLAVHTAALANPSTSDPHAALAVHDLWGEPTVLKEANGVYTAARKTMEGIVASQGKAGAKQFSEAHVSLRRLRRLGLDLQIQGETAGIDFAMRADDLLKQWNEALQAFKNNPANAAQINKIRQVVPAQQQKANMALQNARKLMREQQPLKAYLYLEGIFDEVTFYTEFLSAQESTPLLSDYQRLLPEIASVRHRQLRDQVLAKLEQAGTPLVPDTQTLLATVSAAANALQSTPTADVDGQPLTGPQCLESFVRKWQGIHLNALRCRAIDWARRLTVPQLPYLPVPPTPNRVDADQYAAFSAQMVSSLTSIVAADAQRATDSEASQLYPQYLTVLGTVLPRMADDKLETAVGASLEQLAAKSPELANQVTAYRAATGELLRWRERVAEEEAAARNGQFPPSTPVLEQAFGSRDGYRGLVVPQQVGFEEARLFGHCPEALIGARDQIVGRTLQVGDIAALSGVPMGVAKYAQRHYATLPAPVLTEAIDSLQQDLLVSDQTPPLSLAATVAIASARQGDYLAAGGTVQAVYIEGLVPRFAVLPPAALPMTRLGALESIKNEGAILPHVLVRLQLVPSWIRHRYFFAEIPQS
ncbi:MAG: hypothetical protein KJ000_03635 [Pirellulaceae bacterium]|nr:hypothetical protein [Pirellulaceae bacterium]